MWAITSGEAIASDCSSLEGCLACSPAGHTVRVPSVGHRGRRHRPSGRARAGPTRATSQPAPCVPPSARVALPHPCMHTHTNNQTRTRTHAQARTPTHAHAHTSTHAHAQPDSHTHVHTHTRTCTRTHTRLARTLQHLCRAQPATPVRGPCSPPWCLHVPGWVAAQSWESGRRTSDPVPSALYPSPPGPHVPSPSPFLSAGPPGRGGETGGRSRKCPVVPGPSPQGGSHAVMKKRTPRLARAQVGLLRFHYLAPGP